MSFINKCLRGILHLKWTDKVSNATLWKLTKQIPTENEINKRKWRWIGHTLNKSPETITCQSITWNPSGKRRRGRQRNNWQRETERETKEMGYTRRELERMATDKKQWPFVVVGLCSQQAEMGYTRRELERMATDKKQWPFVVVGLCSQQAKVSKYDLNYVIYHVISG